MKAAADLLIRRSAVFFSMLIFYLMYTKIVLIEKISHAIIRAERRGFYED